MGRTKSDYVRLEAERDALAGRLRTHEGILCGLDAHMVFVGVVDELRGAFRRLQKERDNLIDANRELAAQVAEQEAEIKTCHGLHNQQVEFIESWINTSAAQYQEIEELKAALREFVKAAEKARKAYIVPDSVLDALGYKKGDKS